MGESFMKKFKAVFGSAIMLMASATVSLSNEIPADDRALFSHLFSLKSVPQDWIFKPANEELTPAILEEIATRLFSTGGTYQDATKSAKGWVLDFENGTARARILRAPDNTLIGVFFSALE